MSMERACPSERIPDKGQVTTRYYGWYANRPRGTRDKAALPAAPEPADQSLYSAHPN